MTDEVEEYAYQRDLEVHVLRTKAISRAIFYLQRDRANDALNTLLNCRKKSNKLGMETVEEISRLRRLQDEV